MLESCKYALVSPVYTPVSAIIQLKPANTSFSALSLHLIKVRLFFSPGLKNHLLPRKMHPTRDDYQLVNELNRPEYS